MPPPRFSVRQLLVGTTSVAVAIFALMRADDLKASGLFTLTVGLLLVAIVGGVLSRDRSRAFWIGFAVIGWGYWWVAHWPNQIYGSDNDGHWKLETEQHGSLLTTRVLVFAYQRMLPLVRTPPVASPTQPGGFPGLAPWPGRQIDYPSQQAFAIVGHSFFTILFAYLGGLLGGHFYARRKDEAAGK